MPKQTQMALLLLIVATGGWLRSLGLSWAQGYRSSAIFDELNAYQVALHFLNGDKQAWYLGQPHFNDGHVPGPLWAMLWAVPLRIGGGPDGVTLVIILMNIIAIYVTAVLAGRVFGDAHILWATLFYATAPWAVYFSVGCWNPEVTALLGALLYFALWQVITRPGSPAIFWVCLLLGMLLQFHMFSVFLVPSVVFLLGLRFSTLNKKWLAVGWLAAASLYVPYVWGEATSGWQNTRQILASGQAFSWGSLKSVTLPIICQSNLFASPLGTKLAEYKMFGDRAFGSFVVVALFNALSVGLSVWWTGRFVRAFVRSLRVYWRSPGQALAKSPAVFFVGTLLIIPIILYVFTGHNFSSRYCLPLFPLLFLLPAIFMVDRLSAGRRQRFLFGATALTIGFNVILSLMFYRYRRHLINHADYFVPSFRQMETVYQTLKTTTGPERRIRIDTSAFPGSFEDERARGVLALARYVQIREESSQQSETPAAIRIFRAWPTGNLVAETGRLVYQNNGLAIVDQGSSTGSRSKL